MIGSKLVFFLLFLSATLFGDVPKSVAIFTYKVAGQVAWGPESIANGITGSEEAVIYMSQKLANLGYQVVVFGTPKEGSIHSEPTANPRFVPLDFEPSRKFDIGISWRMPFNGAELKARVQKLFLWPHDTYDDKLTAAQIMSFDGVLWLSEWQLQYWSRFNPLFSKFRPIFGNGINPDQFQTLVEKENPYSCIYSSNYARGLETLLNIWPVVKQHYSRATLDIYYGWQHWGLLSPQKEAQLRAQVEALGPLGVKEHGLVSHEVLTRAHEKASLWTYPCCYPEVFCITALRAQMAGNIPVIIESAALKETVRHGYKCQDADAYLALLLQAMGEIETKPIKRSEMRDFILSEYTWQVIAEAWKQEFEAAFAPAAPIPAEVSG